MIGLNQLYRKQKAGLLDVPQERGDAPVAEYQQVRQQLRRSVALLRLHNSDELAKLAQGVQRYENDLANMRYAGGTVDHAQTDGLPTALYDAVSALDAAIEKLAVEARKVK
ncbi:MAG TPA: hypothetical protein VFX16_21145 [Pseudonocardiaceae bacterium]|nr:hypothetical protein [Pseudonocardiaceae bacterium]